MPTKTPNALLHGTLDALILKTLAGGPRHGAGRRMDYATTDAETIASAIAADIGRTVDYRPVTNDGATRAASLIAELV